MSNCIYNESAERAAEFLRLALPLMNKHRVVTNPQNIALWYEYAAGSNQGLKTAMDDMIGQGQGFDDASARELFRKFIKQDEKCLEQMREALSRLVSDLQQQMRDTGGGLPQYTNTLSQFAAILGASEGRVDVERIDQVLAETRSTHESQQRLQKELATVSAEVEILRRELHQVREESMVDALTGIGNRRSFDLAAVRALDEASGEGELFSILLCDIDHFKKFNDSYGHLIGDRVLRFVARILRKSIKGKDTAARYGGEEFTVLLPDTTMNNAKLVAEEIRREVAAGVLKDSNTGQSFGRITISIGVAKCRRGESCEELVERADKALYRAKQSGRDRVVTAS